MKKYLSIVALLLFALLLGGAQTVLRVNGNGSSGLSYVGPVASLPTSCNIGELAYATDTSTLYASYQSPCAWQAANPGASGLTSVGLSTNLSFMTVGASPLTTNGTLTLNGTTGETANEFVATPNGSTGVVGLRTIAAADVPTLNQSTSGNAATATALAATPSQCSGTGSVALGVAASGNSNCGYPSQSYVQAYLTGSNVTMTNTTGTFYDGPSTGAVAAGSWFVSGYVTLGKASATGQNLVQCKLWDGTTTFATAETSVPYVTTAAATYTVVHLNAVAVEASGGTIKISCENSVASGIIYYQTPTSTLADASGISAVRIQ